jgi:hypothetical protein
MSEQKTARELATFIGQIDEPNYSDLWINQAAALLASQQEEANGCDDCKHWAPDDCKHPDNQPPNELCKLGKLHEPRIAKAPSETAPASTPVQIPSYEDAGPEWHRTDDEEQAHDGSMPDWDEPFHAVCEAARAMQRRDPSEGTMLMLIDEIEQIFDITPRPEACGEVEAPLTEIELSRYKGYYAQACEERDEIKARIEWIAANLEAGSVGKSWAATIAKRLRAALARQPKEASIGN